MRRRPAISLLLAAAVALSAAACGEGGGGASRPAPTTATAPSRKVTLWVDVPLAGRAAQDGRQMLDAVRLVVAQAVGTTGRFAVAVRAWDDAEPASGRSDPARCRAGARRAVADPTAIALIGTYESPCTEQALPLAASGGLALVSPVNTAPGLTAAAANAPRVLVRLAPADARQGAAAAAEAQTVGAHRIFAVTGRSVRARAELSALAAAAPVRRLVLAGKAPSPKTAEAAVALAARIRATRADCVWIGAEPGPGVVALLHALAPPRTLPKAGNARRPKPPVVVASDALYRNGFVRGAGTAAEGLRLTTPFVPATALGGAGADFARAFARQYGEAGPYTAYAADAARLVLAALRRSDGTRAGLLRALFRTRAYDGLIGRLGITASGASTLERFAILRVHDGVFGFERTVDVGRS